MVRLCLFSVLILVFSIQSPIANAQPIVANHLCTDITDIPQQWIDSTKAKLHIAYGHTSHGSQITDGMSGLVAFANGGGKGLSLPNNIFAWNNGGTGGALDLHDYAMGGDVGYYPDWVNNTRSYLGASNLATGRGTGSNADVNVIIWSWCGQAASQTEQSMIDNYLAPMTQLELDYPNVKFVYMTGHLDGTGSTGNLNIRNQQIRDYCEANNKVLFDFADIESYDPDGLINYMALNATDNCAYDSSGTSINWAVRWQNTHTENIDWYSCSAAHSQSLNGNQKAYAAWWLWARLAGWDGLLPVQMTSFTASVQGMNAELYWTTATEINNYGFDIERRTVNSEPPRQEVGGQETINSWQKISFIAGNGTSNAPHEYSYSDSRLQAGRYIYRLKQVDNDAKYEYSKSIEVEVGAVPHEFIVSQNYPNPFNPTTTIEFTLAERSNVSLKVLDILGREVTTLLDSDLEAGILHQVKFDASKLSSGMYFYRLEAGKNLLVKKLVLMK